MQWPVVLTKLLLYFIDHNTFTKFDHTIQVLGVEVRFNVKIVIE